MIPPPAKANGIHGPTTEGVRLPEVAAEPSWSSEYTGRVSRACPLADVRAWMTEHLGERMTLDRLAARAFVSRRQFTRIFRAETGTSPWQWLLTQRLATARRMLEQTDEPIDVIARRCGFPTPAAFRIRFKQQVGDTPSDHRRRMRGTATRPADPTFRRHTPPSSGSRLSTADRPNSKGCAMSGDLVNRVRSEALFVSAVQPSENPPAAQILTAIATTVRTFGVAGCAARMAHEFGEHPDSAVARMRWARQMVDRLFPSDTARPRPSAQTVWYRPMTVQSTPSTLLSRGHSTIRSATRGSEASVGEVRRCAATAGLEAAASLATTPWESLLETDTARESVMSGGRFRRRVGV
jgi:AraC-like DNA-binding protein